MGKVSLASPVSVLYGIGPAAADRLAKLEINTVYDLITFLPWRYNDWTSVSRVSACEGGSEASLFLTVLTNPSANLRSRAKTVSFMAGDETVEKVDADTNEDQEVNVGDMVVITNIMSGN